MRRQVQPCDNGPFAFALGAPCGHCLGWQTGESAPSFQPLLGKGRFGLPYRFRARDECHYAGGGGGRARRAAEGSQPGETKRFQPFRRLALAAHRFHAGVEPVRRVGDGIDLLAPMI